MQLRWKFLAVALVAAVVGFMFQSNSPVGQAIWPPHEGETGETEPTGGALAGLIVMGIVEAFAFGAGVAFLAFGWGLVRNAPGVSRNLAVLAYAAIGWGLVSWVPHTAMHISNAPSDFGRLVTIEYVFHFTLILAAAVLARFFWVTLQARSRAGDARSAHAADGIAAP